jgi:hypothetical protein
MTVLQVELVEIRKSNAELREVVLAAGLLPASNKGAKKHPVVPPLDMVGSVHDAALSRAALPADNAAYAPTSITHCDTPTVLVASLNGQPIANELVSYFSPMSPMIEEGAEEEGDEEEAPQPSTQAMEPTPVITISSTVSMTDGTFAQQMWKKVQASVLTPTHTEKTATHRLWHKATSRVQHDPAVIDACIVLDSILAELPDPKTGCAASLVPVAEVVQLPIARRVEWCVYQLEHMKPASSCLIAAQMKSENEFKENLAVFDTGDSGDAAVAAYLQAARHS